MDVSDAVSKNGTMATDERQDKPSKDTVSLITAASFFVGIGRNLSENDSVCPKSGHCCQASISELKRQEIKNGLHFHKLEILYIQFKNSPDHRMVKSAFFRCIFLVRSGAVNN